MCRRTWIDATFSGRGDKLEVFGVDVSPRYPCTVLEGTEEYRIVTTEWGATMRQFCHQDSTPEFLDYKIKSPAAWKEAKARMVFDEDRLNLKALKTLYRTGSKRVRQILIFKYLK